nr:hypothetical protein [uncultured Methanolobus sp.]
MSGRKRRGSGTTLYRGPDNKFHKARKYKSNQHASARFEKGTKEYDEHKRKMASKKLRAKGQKKPLPLWLFNRLMAQFMSNGLGKHAAYQKAKAVANSK